MKASICLCLVALTPLSAKDGEFKMPAGAAAPAKKIVSAEEISRTWSQAAETRSLNGPPSEARTTKITAEHLHSLKAVGADRGIAVVPDGQGGSQVTVNVNPASSISFPNILFKLNSTELADEASRQQVEQIAQAILQARGKTFVLEGHTCDLGTESHNLGLSERRAAAILNLLALRGVSAAQLLPLGFGESKPAVPNTSEVNREENRRVVISLRQN